ncbi:hypothetical protein N332_06711, partial [Mesitornis unicolor]
FGTLMEFSSTLFEMLIPSGALQNNKIMYLLKKQHGSVCPLDNMSSHCVLYGGSYILSAGQDLAFLNTYKNV